jgi:hypothetical protein
MNPRLSSQGFLVDHVLGWAARLCDAEVARIGNPGTEGQDRPSPGREFEGRAASGDEMEDSRSRSLRFPYSGW